MGVPTLPRQFGTPPQQVTPNAQADFLLHAAVEMAFSIESRRMLQFRDLSGQQIQVGVFPGFLFAVEQAAVGDDLEDPAGTGDQFDSPDAFRSERSHFGRQTGGSRLVVSHLAVLDREVLDHGATLAENDPGRNRAGAADEG